MEDCIPQILHPGIYYEHEWLSKEGGEILSWLFVAMHYYIIHHQWQHLYNLIWLVTQKGPFQNVLVMHNGKVSYDIASTSKALDQALQTLNSIIAAPTMDYSSLMAGFLIFVGFFFHSMWEYCSVVNIKEQQAESEMHKEHKPLLVMFFDNEEPDSLFTPQPTLPSAKISTGTLNICTKNTLQQQLIVFVIQHWTV